MIMNMEDLMVEEYVLIENLKQPDVEDPEKIVQVYSNEYSEELVMIIHTEIPQIMDFSAEALNLIDLHFWRKALAEKLDREYIQGTLVAAIGAYLGIVVARKFEGYWVPRNNLLESQIVVDQIAWLPFLRAQNFLHSRKSTLDYSLRKFYRAVEKHHMEFSSSV